MAKYTVYWYGQNGKTGSESFTVKGAKLEEVYGKGTMVALDNTNMRLKEFAVYNSRGVLIIDEQWDSKKKKWVSVMPKKEDEWHPFGL